MKKVLKNFANFLGKHLCLKLFSISCSPEDLKVCNFIKKRLQQQALSCEISEVFKNNFIKKRLQRRCFAMNFAKRLKQLF